MDNLNSYLNHVQNIEEVELQEDWAIVGFGIALITLFGFSIWSSIKDERKFPKHPKWNKMLTNYRNLYRKCAQYYPDEKTTFKAGGGALQDYVGNIEYKDYKANPERIKCQMTVRLNHLKKFIKWISTAKAEEICKYNTKDQEKCYAYVTQVKERKIGELRDLTRVLSASSKNKPLNRAQFTQVARVLNPRPGKR